MLPPLLTTTPLMVPPEVTERVLPLVMIRPELVTPFDTTVMVITELSRLKGRERPLSIILRCA
jgi:hypothetical protein